MGRAVVILNTDAARTTVKGWVDKSPDGTRVEFKAPKRTIPQNERMWAMLTQVATQGEHMGVKYKADVWKIVFMDALGKETNFVPALDGQSVVPIGHSSSDLSVEEMSDLIEIIKVYAIAHNIEPNDPRDFMSGRDKPNERTE